MMDAITGVIKGHVQGVGFRYFTWNLAKKLNITGWVRNLPDGTVEVLAFGERKILEQFMLNLQRGPVGSRIDNWDFQWLKNEIPSKSFEIRD